MFYLFISVLSLILYMSAPRAYSYTYNIIILVVYVLVFCIFARKERIKALSYPSLLFFVYFFVNFAYPVFIYPFDSMFVLQFKYSFSPYYINSGSAMSLLAFVLFISGYSRRKMVKVASHHKILFLNRKNYKAVLCFSVMVLLYNLFEIIPQIGINYADAKVPFQSGSLFVMLESTLSLLLCYINRFEMKGNTKFFFNKLRVHIFLCLSFAIGCLLLGSREYVLSLTLMFVFLYSYYVRSINSVKMIVGLFVGVLAFFLVVQVRNGTQITNSKELFEVKSWQNGQVSSLWNLPADLIINNRNLYVGMQYVDDPKHGYTYGYNYIPNLLSPIPFLPSLFTTYFLGTTVADLTSQQILTDYTREDLGESRLDYELVYMAFGFIGVILLFYGLGLFVKYLENNMGTNAKAACIYIVLFTGIVFFCRSSFLGPLKNLVWSYWLCCILLKSVNTKLLNRI